MATSPAVLVMTQAISLGLAFLRRIAAPEFSRGFQPTERLENIPSSRERRLNSIVADATGYETHAHRGLKLNSGAAMRRRNASPSDIAWVMTRTAGEVAIWRPSLTRFNPS